LVAVLCIGKSIRQHRERNVRRRFAVRVAVVTVEVGITPTCARG